MPLNIDVFQILLHLLNFVILAGGLSLLLFKPVRRFLAERQASIAKQASENEETAHECARLKEEYEARLRDADTEIATKKLDAEKEMSEAAKQYLTEARTKAAAIVSEAEKDAEEHKEAILESAQTEIGELVVLATQKLLSDTVTPERNSALYDEFIRLADQTVTDKRSDK